MKNVISSSSCNSNASGAAQAERYVMVTHGEGKDPFWPVVQKGGEDAARHVGADFEYIFNPSGDMGDMAKSITAAAATQPDGIVVSCQTQMHWDRLSKTQLRLAFQLLQ